jgi:hypothetical protein
MPLEFKLVFAAFSAKHTTLRSKSSHNLILPEYANAIVSSLTRPMIELVPHVYNFGLPVFFFRFLFMKFFHEHNEQLSVNYFITKSSKIPNRKP